MIPGEIQAQSGELEINEGRRNVTIEVSNTGDRPIQVGSHYHFFEVNDALSFDRQKARGFRLDVLAGMSIRFEPGQSRTIRLVEIGGARRIFGFKGRVMGALE